MFESGLDPLAQNKCQRKEEVGVWPLGWPRRDRSRLFLEKLTVIIEVDHQGARTHRWSCLPVTPPTPTRPPSKHVSRSLSISLLALSPSSNSFCSLSSHSLQSLFFFFFF